MEGASKKLLGGSELIKPEMGLLQSKELYQYILETSVYPNESEFLKELRIATSTLPWSFMLCSPDQGPLMTLLLKLVNAKKTLEIGVFTGYSLLVTALSLPQDGKVIGIDPDRKAYEVGLPIIKKAGVEHKIDFIESPALSVLDNLLEDPKNEGTFDYAFVDADKGNYKNYYERLMKLIRIGGIVLFDNTLWSGTVAWKDDSNLDEFMKGAKDTMIELNKFLASDSRVHMCLLPVGDGLTLCIRLK